MNLLIFFGVTIIFISWMGILVIAFKHKVYWGLIVLFIPIGWIFFLSIQWLECKKFLFSSLAGLVLIIMYFGVENLYILSKSNPEPLKIPLSKLEENIPLTNLNIMLSDVNKVLNKSIYSINEGNGNGNINYVFYPVISQNHQYIKKRNLLLSKYKTYDKIPEQFIPVLSQFSVIVKSYQYKTVSEIPLDLKQNETIRGLVINDIHDLNREELSYLSKEYPSLDFEHSKLIVIEENGELPIVANSILHTSICILLLIYFIYLIVKSFKQEKAAKLPHQKP